MKEISISEMIKYLRELGNNPDVYMRDNDELQDAFLSAADTIEALSAKLQAANMDSAKDCGEWITSRVPTKEECEDCENEFFVIADVDGLKPMKMYFEYKIVRGREAGMWKWTGMISPWKVFAWKPLPGFIP